MDKILLKVGLERMNNKSRTKSYAVFKRWNLELKTDKLKVKGYKKIHGGMAALM